ncbi:MAG: putative phosphoglycerate mutase [Myxococcota bacterium]|jgi:probable phosphoglycerate mutase
MKHSHQSLERRPDALIVALVRHGRTSWNAQGRFLGHTDIPLDDQGLSEARALGQVWYGAFDEVYTSPLARAQQTAAELADAPSSDPSWMELAQGELEGLRPEEGIERYPDFFRAWGRDPAAAVVPGGERLCDCRDRAMAALEALVARHAPGDRVAVVTHQVVIASIQCTIRGRPLADWRQFRVGNTAIVGLEHVDGRWIPHAPSQSP